MLGLPCCPGFSPSAASRGSSVVVVGRLSLWWPLILGSPGFRAGDWSSCESWASLTPTYGISPDVESIWCPLPCKRIVGQ